MPEPGDYHYSGQEIVGRKHSDVEVGREENREQERPKACPIGLVCPRERPCSRYAAGSISAGDMQGEIGKPASHASLYRWRQMRVYPGRGCQRLLPTLSSI